MSSSLPQILQPPEWPRPKGYSNGISVAGRQVFIAGQIGWDASCKFAGSSMAAQVRRALENILAILAEAGGKREHIVRLTWFVTSRDEYLQGLKAIGESYRAVMGKHFPTMSVVQVVALMESEAKVEIEATAVIPPAS
jgi:enamine deaminase RidA (YjgF/YER057c/UK114 family)